ncbi:MAG: hypothetical protein GF411_19355 [Candidatus Lokiarchaeota archaeon]|nr:hypothetical protein [Candidatus Lokiarchaeota archaeon]
MSEDTESREVNVEDLEPKMRSISIEFKVIDKGEPRFVKSKYDGESHRVLDAIVGDETGIVTMPLWDDSIEEMEIGKTYRLENGFTGLYRKQLRLKIGRHSEVSTLENGGEIDEVNRETDMSEQTHGRKRRDYGGGYDMRRGKSRDSDKRDKTGFQGYGFR